MLTTSPRGLFAQHRQRARTVKGAENAAAVLTLLRPRGVSGFRGQFPVTLQLARANRERRLLTSPDGSFVMLGAPHQWRPADDRVAATALRLLDEHWELVWFYGVVGLLVLSAVPCALVPGGLAVALVILLCALSMVGIFSLVAVLRTLWNLYMVIEPRRWSPRGEAVEQYAAEEWSVPLWHVVDLSRVDEQVDQVLTRVAELRSEFRTPSDPGRATPAPVMVRDDAVTTVAAARAVAAATQTTQSASDGTFSGVMFLHRASLRAWPSRPSRPVTSFTALFVLIPLYLVVDAHLISGVERDACAPASCAGRPADFVSALRWTGQRLLWSDPQGLSPGTFLGWWFGWGTSALTPILMAALVMTAKQVRTHLNQRRTLFEQEMSEAMATTSTLVLVAADVERSAVITSVTAATGRGDPVPREPCGPHTVFDLGVLSRTRVLLAQSEQGIENPSAMTMTASHLIRERQPDYVVLVGICYGLRGEPQQSPGDIVVASQVQNLNWRRAQHRDGMPAELIRGERVAASPTLLDRFRAATVNWVGAPVHRGLMLSESVLVDSPLHRARRQEQFPDALAAEMEGAGVYAAAAVEHTEWIMVKAISDWGDGTKNSARRPETAQEEAARNVADFLVHVLGEQGLDRPARSSAGRIRAPE